MSKPEVHSTITRRSFVGATGVSMLALLASCSAPESKSVGKQAITVGIPKDVVPANMLRKVGANFPVRSLVFETLINVDPKTGNPVPNLATSWKANADSTEFTLQLRKDVTFHTGRKFTADDVVASLETAMKPDVSPVQDLTSTITSVKALGKHEVRISLNKSLGSFAMILAEPIMIDSKTFSQFRSGDKMVGTGPFVWKSWTPKDHVELRGYKDYWNKAPDLDKVTLKVLASSEAMKSGLRSGLVDMTTQMIPKDAVKFKDDKSFHLVSAKPVFTEWAMSVNTAVKPLDDVRVRQAIAWAIDKDRINSQVFGKTAAPSSIPALPTLKGVTKKLSDAYDFDLDKGKKLLKEAGANGAEVKLYWNSSNQTVSQIATIAQYNLTQLGLKVTPFALEQSAYQAASENGSYDGLWISPYDGLSRSLQSSSMFKKGLGFAHNASNFENDTYTKLSKAMVTAPQGAALEKATKAWLEFYVKEAFRITLVHSYYLAVVKKSITGVAYNGTAELDLHDAEVES